MNKLFFLIVIIFSIKLSAQPVPLSIDTLSFAHFEANKFIFDMDSSLLPLFFQKFDSVVFFGQGRVNIVHIGGSHVQAGTFPHRVRQNLWNAFPDRVAGRGMIFPYSVVKNSNNPIDYTLSKQGNFTLSRNVQKAARKQLGVTGGAIFSRDTNASISFRWRVECPFVTTRIVIFGAPTRDSNYQNSCQLPINRVPVVVLDSTEYFPIAIDTILERYTYETAPFSGSFTVKLPGDSSCYFTLTGILLNNDLPGITYHSLGINGASVGSFLGCENFSRDLACLQPDLVIFGLGINDAAASNFDSLEFKNNYLLLVEKIKEVNPRCAFVFITNNDSYRKIGRRKYKVNHHGLAVEQQMYRLAAQTKGAVWDQFHIMGGLTSMSQWQEQHLAQHDKVHFTYKGYQLLGDLFFNAFLSAAHDCRVAFSEKGKIPTVF
jgi:lysophospholipase L1-like esterase